MVDYVNTFVLALRNASSFVDFKFKNNAKKKRNGRRQVPEMSVTDKLLFREINPFISETF